MKNKLRLGFAQFPLILGLLIMAIAVPVATRLVEEGNMDTRNRATGSYSCQKMLYSEVNCRSAPRIVEGPYTSSEDKSECVSDFEAGSSYRIVCTSIGSVPSPTVPVATATVPATTAYDASKCANEPNNDDWCVATDDERADCRVLQGVETTVASTVCSAGKCCRVTLPRGNPCLSPSLCVDGSGLQPRGTCTAVGGVTGTVEPNGECSTTSVCCRVGVSAAGSPTVPAGATVTSSPAAGALNCSTISVPAGKAASCTNENTCKNVWGGEWKGVSTYCTVVGDGCCVASVDGGVGGDSGLKRFNVVAIDADGKSRWTKTACPGGKTSSAMDIKVISPSLTVDWKCPSDTTVGGHVDISAVAMGTEVIVELTPPAGTTCTQWEWQTDGGTIAKQSGSGCRATFTTEPTNTGDWVRNLQFKMKTATAKKGCGQTCSSNSECESGYCVRLSNGTNVCRNLLCLQSENCVCQTATATPTATRTPTTDPSKKGCGQLCLNDGECISGFCNTDVGRCRNNLCPESEDCVCQTATATPTGPATQLGNVPNFVATCDVVNRKATLTWGAVSGANVYALRVNNTDTGWNGKCGGTDGNPLAGDLCKNDVVGTSWVIRNVSLGVKYSAWIHAMSNAFPDDWRSRTDINFTCGLVTPRLFFASDPVASVDNTKVTFSYDYNGKNTTSQKMFLDFYWRVKGTTAWTRISNTLPRNGFDFGQTSMTKTLVADNLGKTYQIAIEAVVFDDANNDGDLDSNEVFKRCSGREGLSTEADCLSDNMREVSIPAPGTTLTPTATTTTAPGLAKQACCGACGVTNSQIGASYGVATGQLTASFPLAKNGNEADVAYEIKCFYNDGGNDVELMGVGTTTISGATTMVNCAKDLSGTVGFNGNIYVYAKITTTKGTSTAVCDGTNGTCVSCGQKTATIVGAPTATTTPVTCKPSLVAPVSGNRVDSPVTLRWNNNCGDANSRYVVKWWEDATGGVTNCSGALGAGVVEKVVTLYEANKVYKWMVRKCSTWNCQEGCETGAVGQYLPWSDVRSFTINTPSDLPFTPTPTPTLDPAEACRIESVSCGPVTVDSVKLNLTYNQVVNSRIAGLKIQRNADIAMTLPAGATVAQVGDTGLTASTTYKYKAYCYGADGATFTHTVKSVDCRTADTPIGPGCPNCPAVTSEIVARNDGKYNVKLSWPASTNATGYQIWRNKMDGSGTDMGFARVVENQAGLVWIDDNDGLGYEIAKDVQYKVLPLKASSDCGVPSGCTVEEVRVTVVGPGPGGACANECPSSFKCYRKGTTGNDYRWFADGYVGAGYTVQAGVTTAAGCGNVAVPTFQGKRKGDANCDGKINLEDASSWRKEYVEGDTGTVTKNNWLADFNCDQKVGTADRSIWRDSYSSMQ